MDTLTLPYSDLFDYQFKAKDELLARIDRNRIKPEGISIYLVDKQNLKTKLNCNFKIKSSNCGIENLNSFFKVYELNTNVFSIIMTKFIKKECIINFELDIKTDLKSNTYNREVYNVNLIIYSFDKEFSLIGDLQ